MKSINIKQGRTEAPCKECNGHSETCHFDCKAYLDYLDIHKKERAEYNKRKHQENLSYGAPYRTKKQMDNIKSNLWKFR